MEPGEGTVDGRTRTAWPAGSDRLDAVLVVRIGARADAGTHMHGPVLMLICI